MTNFFLRAFALSFSIFWRGIPFWVVLAAAIYMLASFFEGHPFIFAFFLMLCAGTTIVFMIFSHIRTGFVVLGEVTSPDIGKLFVKSFKFFRFFVVFNALLSAISYCGYITFAKLGLIDMESLEYAVLSGNPELMQRASESFMQPAVYAYYTVVIILSQLAYSSLAVPMAANAASCSAKAKDYEIFWGFGSYAFRMFLLNIVSSILTSILMVAYGYIAMTMPMFDGQSIMQLVQSNEFTAPTTWSSYVMIAAVVALPIFGFVWMVCFWCAGATLCFMDKRDYANAEKAHEMARVFEAPLDGNELRALRASRMAKLA